MKIGKSQILWRPVNKPVLLLENEMIRFPDKGTIQIDNINAKY